MLAARCQIVSGGWTSGTRVNGSRRNRCDRLLREAAHQMQGCVHPLSDAPSGTATGLSLRQLAPLEDLVKHRVSDLNLNRGRRQGI